MNLTPEQIDTLFGELAEMFQAARMEARALRQLLIEHGVFTEEEMAARIDEVTRAEMVDLKAEMYRRALDKAAEGGPVQETCAHTQPFPAPLLRHRGGLVHRAGAPRLRYVA